MTLSNILALAVVLLAVPFNWYVTWLSWSLSKATDNWALRAFTFVLFTLAVLVTIFGIVFVNNDMAVPPLDPGTTKILTRAAMLGLSVPGLYWLYLMRKA